MIPVNAPVFGVWEKKFLNRCLSSGSVSGQSLFVEGFEKEFSSYIGKDFGIAVCNGSAAIETALHTIGIKKGDEVILPSLTIISCATAILRFGAKPVLVDCDKEFFCLDISKIEEKITSRTKAIMAVHLLGNPVDMESLLKLSRKYGLKVIEDASQAHGTLYKNKKVGSFGDISVFSFYANKIITTGEGGMVLVNNQKLAERARDYRNLYFGKKERYRHKDLGMNFRMSGLQAALGLGQLKGLEKKINKKRRLAFWYQQELEEVKNLKVIKENPFARSIFWQVAIIVNPDLGKNATWFGQKLLKRGIETRPFFLGLHRQPVLLDHKAGEFPNTDLVYKYGLLLPSGSNLKRKEISFIAGELKKYL